MTFIHSTLHSVIVQGPWDYYIYTCKPLSYESTVQQNLSWTTPATRPAIHSQISLSGLLFHDYFMTNLSNVVPSHLLGTSYGHKHLVVAISFTSFTDWCPLYVINPLIFAAKWSHRDARSEVRVDYISE